MLTLTSQQAGRVVSIPTRIGEVLSDLGVSQNEAARRAGINPGNVNRALRKGCGLRLMERLGEALGVPAFVFQIPREAAAIYVEKARLELEKRERPVAGRPRKEKAG